MLICFEVKILFNDDLKSNEIDADNQCKWVNGAARNKPDPFSLNGLSFECAQSPLTVSRAAHDQPELPLPPCFPSLFYLSFLPRLISLAHSHFSFRLILLIAVVCDRLLTHHHPLLYHLIYVYCMYLSSFGVVFLSFSFVSWTSGHLAARLRLSVTGARPVK